MLPFFIRSAFSRPFVIPYDIVVLKEWVDR